MKRLLSLIVIAGMCTFVACGPSAEEKAKAAEKATQDSIAKEQVKIDSLQKIEAAKSQDSIAKAAEAMKADSLQKAEEASKTAKPAKKAKK